jgi:hypothetical protein
MIYLYFPLWVRKILLVISILVQSVKIDSKIKEMYTRDSQKFKPGGAKGRGLVGGDGTQEILSLVL